MAPVPTLSDPQRRLLVALKRRGEATVDELCDVLGVTASAVRQQVSALEASGLVTSRREQGRPGRPANRYRATDRAEPCFEADDARLSVELLGHLEAEDPDLVARIFDRRRQQMVADARDRVVGLSGPELIASVAELLDAQGYLADADEVGEGRFRINLHNCPVWTVANRYRQACTSELDFIRDLIPGAAVERVTHKTAGAHTCAYDVVLPA